MALRRRLTFDMRPEPLRMGYFPAGTDGVDDYGKEEPKV
jgi:hypothetical protein